MNSGAFNDSANNAGINSPNAAVLIPGLTDLEVDYGYNTEEDSIFQSFVQEIERTLPKVGKQVTT